MRENFRVNARELPAVDIMLIAQPKVASLTRREFKQEIERVFEFIGDRITTVRQSPRQGT